MAVHTGISPKHASLHLKLQHGLHEAQVSFRVEGDLAFSGRVTGCEKKEIRYHSWRSDASPMRGRLSQIVPDHRRASGTKHV